MRKFILSILCCIGLSGTSHAAVSAYLEVGELAINIGRIYVKVVGFTPTDCGTQNGWMVRSVTEPGADQMLSILMSAKLSGKRVMIRTNGVCDGTYPVFDYVNME